MALFGQLILDGMSMGLVYVILACGLVLIMSVSRIFFIAYGDFYLIGAYVLWGSMVLLHLPFIVGMLFAILATGILGVLSYSLIFEHLRKRESVFLYNMLAATGLMLVLGQGSLLVVGTTPKTAPTVFPGILNFAGMRMPLAKLVLVGLAVFITLTMFFIYERTKLGRAMRSVAHNPEAATLQGVNGNMISMAVLGFSGALAGFAGAIMAPVYVIYPGMGSDIIFGVMLVVMLGGMGSLIGAVFGGLVMGLTMSFGTFYLGAWAQIALFVVIGVIMYFRPGGLLGGTTLDI
jgi:branched-chain amino acid transport system permease protein